MSEYEAIRQMLVEVLGGDEEAEFELQDYLSDFGEWMDLISFAGDREDHVRFRDEWNKRYPRVPVRIRWCEHDFGGYWTVEVLLRDDVDTEMDVEDVSTTLADELGLEY